MFEKTLRGTTALAAIALAGPALADVTADEVWAEWKSFASSYGQDITTDSEVKSGDTLVISGFNVTTDVPDAGEIRGRIDEITFAERSDGSVEITMSPSYPLIVDMVTETGETIKGEVVITQTGMTTVVTGEVGSLNYDFLAPSLKVAMDQIEVDGETVQIGLEAVLNALTGRYEVEGTDTPIVTSTMDADDMTLAVNVQDPEGDGRLVLDLTMAALSATSEGTALNLTNMVTFSDMVAAGFDTSGAFTYGATSYTMEFEDGRDAFAAAGSMASGNFDFSLGPDGVDYGGGNREIELTMSGSDIPLPQLRFGIAETEGRLAMPLTPSDDEKPFGMVSRISGLVVDEGIWSLFDPAGVLPRDPASLTLRIEGLGKWLIDITDPEVADSMAFEAPGEVNSINLTEILLSVAGAELTGDGAFSFDNSNLETFDGLPAPDGSVNFQLVGGNGLLDKLVQMGLLPDEQAMGARMMLGLFARPGDGEDTLVSTIEVKPDGSVSANGQRIR